MLWPPDLRGAGTRTTGVSGRRPDEAICSVLVVAKGAEIGHSARVLDSPFDALVDHELDTVSFVRDYVELRIDYSIVRLLTDPSGSIDDDTWSLSETSGADALRCYIGRKVLAAEFDPRDHLRLVFDGGAIISASLRDEDRTGPEALHFLQADAKGQVHAATTWIW
jgi:hypothetical protein